MGLFGKSRKEKLMEVQQILISEAEGWLKEVNRTHKLPIFETSMMTKDDESVYFYSTTALFETRGTRYSSNSGSGGSIRVMKGVYVRGGGSSGTSETVQEMKQIDVGSLILTNKRLVFHGKKESRTIPLDKIVNIDNSLDAVRISTSSKSKIMVFKVPNPYIFVTIYRILFKCPDPSSLDTININFQ